MRRRQFLIGVAAGVAAAVAAPFWERWRSPGPAARQGVRLDTTADLSTKLLASSPMPVFGTPRRVGSRDVTVDTAQTFQPFLGVGAALTDAAAYVLTRYMTAAQRRALLTEMFAPPPVGHGWSVLRVCIGSSDFRSELVGYTYDDLPAGQSDPAMAQFSVARDNAYIIPVIREILAVNPSVRILATPWTPPAWMLASGTFEGLGGTFRSSDMGAYALYLVKFIQTYEAAGIPIWAITCQNEPIAGGAFIAFSVSQQESFIGGHLVPALAAAGLSPKIFVLDDQWSNASYGEQVASNSGSGPHVAGFAWHGYTGGPSAMTSAHSRHPAAEHHLTEWRSLISESLATQMATTAGGYCAQGVANWAQSVILWNLALDQNGAPNHNKPGRLGVVTVDNATGAVRPRTGYYALTHLAVSAQPGAVRCASTTYGPAYEAYSVYPSDLTTAALVNPDGSRVLYVYNGRASAVSFQIIDKARGEAVRVTMAAGELSTFTW